MTDVLVIGAGGYIGEVTSAALQRDGHTVTRAVRRATSSFDVVLRDGSDLDRLLARRPFDRIIHLPQLTLADADWLLERIDGSRWCVLSSAQLGSPVPAPNAVIALARERVALDRGAMVLRPTMIFGHGRDVNVSRLIRLLVRWHLGTVIGHGDQLVQPLHVDDLVALFVADVHNPRGGLFDVGGPEAVTTRELLGMLAEILGGRRVIIPVPPWLTAAAMLGGSLIGLRRDQVARLVEDKVVDLTAVSAAISWRPQPLAHRLEQACQECAAVGVVG